MALDDRIVITGIGLTAPNGNDLTEYRQNLLDGKSGVSEITAYDTTAFKTKCAAQVFDFDAQALFGRDARKMDRFLN